MTDIIDFKKYKESRINKKPLDLWEQLRQYKLDQEYKDKKEKQLKEKEERKRKNENIMKSYGVK